MPDVTDRSIRIGRDDAWRGVALAVALFALAGLWIALGGNPVSIGIAYTVGPAVGILHTVLVHRAGVVLLEDDALVVESRGKRTGYRWEDLLEVGWVSPGFLVFGAGPVVRPKGGPYDMPGPNDPRQVATVAVFGRRAQERARDVLGVACERHGVPFARGTMQTPPPGSPLRDPGNR